jgi:hypothetical protein
MRRIVGFRRISSVVLTGLFLFFPGLLFAQDPIKAPWWEIKMTITVQGEYRQDAREVTHSGTYAFTIVWAGAMEKDPDDYILYHTSYDLTRWEAEERAAYPQEMRTLTTQDFQDKPELKVNYVLRKDGRLYFDFIIKGFEAPLSPAPEHFPVQLPASEENTSGLAGSSYNPHVQTGSNKVYLEEKQFEKASLEKDFAWTWKFQTWVQQMDKSIFQANSHKVQVKIFIAPRK